MRRPLALFALALIAMVLFSASRVALAATDAIAMVSATNTPAQDCTGSVLDQYSNPSAGNLCWSGTKSSDYQAFSLSAMEAGVEVFPLVANGSPTLEVYNDTGSTTVRLKLVGAIAANDSISCQAKDDGTGCEISGPLGTVGSPTSGTQATVYGPESKTASWPATVTITFYGVPLNAYAGLQWSSWNSKDESGIYLGGEVPAGNSASCPGNLPLGLVNAYNLISLTGDISDAADITGRIAAAGQVTRATTIGTDLRTSDPYIGLASTNGGPWAIVAAQGISTGDSFNINAGGNVYSSTATSAGFNFANEVYAGSPYAGSSLRTGGSSPIDFSSLSANMESLSSQLAETAANGVVCSVDNSGSIVTTGGCPSSPIYFNSSSQHYSPSWTVLYGTSTTTNIFNITQAQFQDSRNLDIEVPTGSTAIINVAGKSDTLQSGVYFQGNMVTDANAGEILFNFPAAASVSMNGQIDGTVLAPHAVLSGESQMGGAFVAASIDSTGEVHYDPFSGSIPNNGNCSSTPAPLSVTCAAVTAGIVGEAFDSGPITVSGGTAPYIYSIVGTLPAGLMMNKTTGEVTGTPKVSGTFSVKVTDASGTTGTACPITIEAPLSVTCAAVTAGEVGVPFNSGPITVSGGTAPYIFSAVGTVPAGLTVNKTTGEVTGTPRASGTFSVEVTDSKGVTGTACPITIKPELSVTCALVKTGEVGIAFNSGPMTVSGGTAPYTYSIIGTLPAGLELSPTTGAVTGKPTTAGSFSVKVTDADGATATACPITIETSLSVTCALVKTGEVGATFNSGPMTVSGGTAPYTYSIIGTLPAGLTLNSTTGAVTGTPTAAGTFSVEVTDADGGTATACPITIKPGPSVTCALVKTGEVGATFNSGPMTVSGGTAPYTYSILGTLPTGLTLNRATGAVTGTPTTAGTFAVMVTDADGATGAACPITIEAPLAVTCAAMKAGAVNAAFNSGPMTVSGGMVPYIYSIIGTLPAGLQLSPTNGAVTGTPTASGSFSVEVTDTNGVMATACPITITDGVPLQTGDTATIGYWNNKNGQALIDDMNGGPSATNLASWLADGFPWLYGANSSNNLTGKTNADVAALFQTFFKIKGAPKMNAQVMAGALATYVTNSSLAGSTVASTFGFNVSSTGTGAKTYNVAGDGTSVGLDNNTSYTVTQLLQQANLEARAKALSSNSTAFVGFNNIFTGINQDGDIGGGTGTPGYTLAVNPSKVTVVAGESATTTFTFTPYGGYAGTVDFSCSGLPAGATCTFVPASLTADGSDKVQTSTLTITTSASGTATIAENRTGTGSGFTPASILLLPAILLGGLAGWRRRSLTSGARGMLLLGLIGLMLVGGAIGCGTVFSQSPLGQHVVTVTASSTASGSASGGSTSTQTANFTLNIIQ